MQLHDAVARLQLLSRYFPCFGLILVSIKATDVRGPGRRQFSTLAASQAMDKLR
jgi:hypothetical protein